VLVAALEGPAEALEVGRAEPELAAPVEDVDPRVFRRELVGDRAGAVGRGVVDDEDVESRVLCEDHWDETGQVLPLVVGRDDDQAAVVASFPVHGVSGIGFRLWAASRPRRSGRARSGRSSTAVNQTREASETTSAAGAGITSARRTPINPSRTPMPAGAKTAM